MGSFLVVSIYALSCYNKKTSISLAAATLVKKSCGELNVSVFLFQPRDKWRQMRIPGSEVEVPLSTTLYQSRYCDR